jgi:hypothetical protein
MSETAYAIAVDAIQKQLVINRENAGKEFYRHDYDLACHVYSALVDAGLKVVNQPGAWKRRQGKTLVSLSREGKL